MAVRQDLYDAFENYDKPDENDFRLLIDTAAKPSNYEELIIPNTSDVLTDINSIDITLAIRDVKIIKHGVSVYLMATLEGDYGLNGIPITADMLGYLGAIGAQGLTKELISDFTIGGISKNQVFPIGTSFESMWTELLTTTGLSNLTYISTPQETLFNLDGVLNITEFRWLTQGVPQNMNLSDDKGIYSSAVIGNSQVVDLFYSYAVPTTVRWTLSSPGLTSTIEEASWVLPYYWGSNITGNVPNEAEILAGSSKLEKIVTSVTVSLNTTSIEYGWIAVSSDFNFTKWWINELNNADLSSNGFMRNAGTVQVNGKPFDVYIYNYSSDLATITLL